MEHGIECHPDVHWDINKVNQITISTNSGSNPTSSLSMIPLVEIDINLYFKCTTIFENWAIDEENNMEFLTMEQEPIIEIYVPIDHKKEFFSDDTHETIQRALSGWPISINLREKLATDVICETEKMIESIRMNSPGRYMLNVAIEVTNQHNHVYDASDDMNENLMMMIIDQSMSESCPSMVPATISSIESLKTTEFACANNGNCESCSICLDEFFNGCKVVHMPCNHPFHRDCISEWLRSSHCCPNCRFEMPTN